MGKYVPGHVGDCGGEGEEVGVALAGAHDDRASCTVLLSASDVCLSGMTHSTNCNRS